MIVIQLSCLSDKTGCAVTWKEHKEKIKNECQESYNSLFLAFGHCSTKQMAQPQERHTNETTGGEEVKL